MKPVYRQSAIATFLRCGLRYYHEYIAGIERVPSGALTLGSALHKATGHLMAEKAATKQTLPLEMVLDIFSHQYDGYAEDTDFGDESRGHLKDIGAKCVEIYYREAAPFIDPVSVEEEFVLETDLDYDVKGTIDLIDADGLVRDTKTTGAKYPDDAVFGKLQPAMYDWAYEATRGKKSTGFVYDVLVKTKKPYYQKVTGTITDPQRDFLFQTINTMHASIQAGIFNPAPDDAWYCSQKWCPAWSACKGKNK